MKAIRNTAVINGLKQRIKGKPDYIADHRPLPALPANAWPRVLVATLPKAGTYLISNMLAFMGFHQTYFHLGRNKMQAYDPCMLQEGVDAPRQFDARIPMRESCHLIRSGEFAASHFAPDADVTTFFRDFHVISCIRELRAMMVSYANFICAAGPHRMPDNTQTLEQGLPHYIRECGPTYLRDAEAIYQWRNHANALMLRMEDIFESPFENYKAIADHLGISIEQQAFDWDHIKNMNSMTKNTDKKLFEWSDAAEEAFEEISGPQTNERLGY